MNLLQFIFLSFSLATSAVNIETNNQIKTDNLQIIGESRQGILETEEEINTIVSTTYEEQYETNVLFSLPREDQYEINDSYLTATKICPDNFYLLSTYDAYIDANLDYIDGHPEEDYYYFTLFTDSKVTIETDADPTSLGNFIFSLHEYNYHNVSNGEAKHDIENIVYYDGTRTVSYVSILKPGTYLIHLIGCQNSKISNDLPYSLYINVTKTNNSPNIYVPDLYNDKSVKGAVWLSDFIPTNNFSIFDLNGEYVYYKRNGTSLQYPDYALDKLREISNGSPIKLATYYIWDPLLKHTLYEIFTVLKQQFNNMIVQNERIAGELRLQQDQITGLISVIVNITGLMPITLPVSIALNVISEIGFNVIEKYFKAITPEFDVNKAQYLSYISSLAAYFDLGLTEEEKKDISKIYAKDDSKIIQVPVYYSLGVNGPIASNYDEHYYSLKVTSSEFFNIDSLIYNDSYFYSSYPNDYYCRGKIYKIKDFNDIVDFSSLELASPHSHKNKDHYCTICGEYIATHDYHEPYTWKNYTRHFALCGCGQKALQGHAVSSNAFGKGNRYATCLLCGGQAEIGIAELSSENHLILTTINGSFVLSNGVIILVDKDIEAYLNGTLIFYEKDDSVVIKKYCPIYTKQNIIDVKNYRKYYDAIVKRKFF